MSTDDQTFGETIREQVAETITPTTKHTLQAKFLSACSSVADSIRPSSLPSSDIEATTANARVAVADQIDPTLIHKIEGKAIEAAGSAAEAIRPQTGFEKVVDTMRGTFSPAITQVAVHNNSERPVDDFVFATDNAFARHRPGHVIVQQLAAESLATKPVDDQFGYAGDNSVTVRNVTTSTANADFAQATDNIVARARTSSQSGLFHAIADTFTPVHNTTERAADDFGYATDNAFARIRPVVVEHVVESRPADQFGYAIDNTITKPVLTTTPADQFGYATDSVAQSRIPSIGEKAVDLVVATGSVIHDSAFKLAEVVGLKPRSE